MRRFIAFISTCAVGLAIVAMPSPALSETKAIDEQPRVQVQPRSAAAWDDTYVEAGDISVTGGGSANPASLAIDANDDTVYVANSYMGTVEVIAPGQTTGNSSATIHVRTADGAGDSGLFGIAVDSNDDTIYVVDRAINPKRLWAINGQTLTVDDTVVLPCDNDLHDSDAYRFITVSSTDDTVYVPCDATDANTQTRLVALDGKNLDDSTAYTSPTSFVGSGITMGPTDDTVYLAGWWNPVADAQVRPFQPSTLGVGTPFTGGMDEPQGIAILDDTLYVSNLNTAVTIFNLKTGARSSVAGTSPWVGTDVASYPTRDLVFLTTRNSRFLVISGDGLLRQTIALNVGVDSFVGSSAVVSSIGLVYVGSYGSSGDQRVVKVLMPDLAPTNVAGTAPYYNQVNVTWDPAATALAPGVDWYRVTASPGGNTCFAQAPSTSCVVGGLTTGTPYTFTVQALVAPRVWSLASAASSAVTPPTPPSPSPAPGPAPAPEPTPPGVPVNVTATAGDARATVSWSPPTYAGTAPISVYRVTASPGGERCLVDAPRTSCVMRDLANGTAYAFSVQALNAGGWGPSASSGPVTPVGPPNYNITLDPGERTANGVNDVVSTMGETSGIPAGAKLTPYVRSSRGAAYVPGVANVVVAADGTFTWSREVRKSKPLFAYMAYEGAESNIVIWVRLDSKSGGPGRTR